MHLLQYSPLPDGKIDIKLAIDINEKDLLWAGYVILSHTWGPTADEVSFEDMRSGTAKSKKGWAKIEGFCRTVLRRRPWNRFVWVDSCCIDKKSSAELSETITSMYRLYQNAKVCYIFLEDVGEGHEGIGLYRSEFRRSRWFTRGWTLQELLAPSICEFYNRDWQLIGQIWDEAKHKCLGGVFALVSHITGINESVLTHRSSFQSMSVAQKMSWAAHRTTTRVEDIAYSLFGIFNVYIAPLYGEGTNAFVRLQEEIIRTTNDHSLFAWEASTQASLRVSPMLAQSPFDFRDSVSIQPTTRLEKRFPGARLDYRMTNRGLSITLPIIKITGFSQAYFAALLSCGRTLRSYGGSVCFIYLEEVGRSHDTRVVSRVHLDSRGLRQVKVQSIEGLDVSTEAVYIVPEQFTARPLRDIAKGIAFFTYDSRVSSFQKGLYLLNSDQQVMLYGPGDESLTTALKSAVIHQVPHPFGSIGAGKWQTFRKDRAISSFAAGAHVSVIASPLPFLSLDSLRQNPDDLADNDNYNAVCVTVGIFDGRPWFSIAIGEICRRPAGFHNMKVLKPVTGLSESTQSFALGTLCQNSGYNLVSTDPLYFVTMQVALSKRWSGYPRDLSEFAASRPFLNPISTSDTVDNLRLNQCTSSINIHFSYAKESKTDEDSSTVSKDQVPPSDRTIPRELELTNPRMKSSPIKPYDLRDPQEARNLKPSWVMRTLASRTPVATKRFAHRPGLRRMQFKWERGQPANALKTADSEPISRTLPQISPRPRKPVRERSKLDAWHRPTHFGSPSESGVD